LDQFKTVILQDKALFDKFFSLRFIGRNFDWGRKALPIAPSPKFCVINPSDIGLKKKKFPEKTHTECRVWLQGQSPQAQRKRQPAFKNWIGPNFKAAFRGGVDYGLNEEGARDPLVLTSGKHRRTLAR
jgi:hypothetical protein